MKKAKKLIITVVVLVILAIIVVVMSKLFVPSFTYKLLPGKMPESPLTEYYYTYGGDMNGSYSMEKVQKVDGEKAIVVTSHTNWHYEDEAVSEYYVPLSVLSEIQEAYNSCRMYTFEKLPQSDVFALDAGTAGYSFRHEDSTYVHFSDNQQIPNIGYEALRKIHDIVQKAINDGEKLPGLENELHAEEEYVSKIVKGECHLQVYKYCNNCLDFRICNGLEEEVRVNGEVKLYLENGDNRVEIDHNLSTVDYEIPSGCMEESHLAIKGERLGVGTYTFVVADLETSFEIK